MAATDSQLYPIIAAAEAVKATFRRRYGIPPKGPGPHPDSSYGLPLPPADHPQAVQFARAVLRRAHQAKNFEPEKVAQQVARARRILATHNAKKTAKESAATPWRAVDWVDASRKTRGYLRLVPRSDDTIASFRERHPFALPRARADAMTLAERRAFVHGAPALPFVAPLERKLREADKEDERARTIRDFHAATNMGPSELEAWLEKPESQTAGTGVGHKSGRRIVAIKRKKSADLTDDDLAHMRKVTAYVARHKGEGPAKSDDGSLTPSAISLRNWGHDPLKESAGRQCVDSESPLREATVADDGAVKDVLLIRAGPGNPVDRRYYTPEALTRAIESGVFEGARCFFDHPSTIEEQTLPERSVRALAGWYSDAYVADYVDPKLGATKAVFAMMHPAVANAEVASIIRTCIEFAKRYPDKAYAGLSVHAYGSGEQTEIDGQSWLRIDEITAVDSVDIVTRAGAGGAIIPVKESYRMASTTAQADIKTVIDGAIVASESKKHLREVAKPAVRKLLEDAGVKLSDDQDKQLDDALGIKDGGAIDQVVDKATGVSESDDEGDGDASMTEADMDNMSEADVDAMPPALAKAMLKKKMAKERTMSKAMESLKTRAAHGDRVLREADANAVVTELKIPDSFRPRLVRELVESDARNRTEMMTRASEFDAAYVRPLAVVGHGALRESTAATHIDLKSISFTE